MQRSMAVQWPCMKQEASQRPEWHSKVEPMVEPDMSDQKSGEVPVARTAEVCKTNESQGAMGPANDA